LVLTPRIFSDQAVRPAVDLPLSGRDPKLIVVVDTEEEFDWSRPHSRSAVAVDHVRHLDRTQTILERYALIPTYVTDYAIASQEQGFEPLREWLEKGRCEIGAHLHPWINPPFDEALSSANSYPGNLPGTLEREKLARLTDIITANFGRRPEVYRAGRYGIGPNTGGVLEELGYLVDSSVVPRTSFAEDGGPDFSHLGASPFRFGPSQNVLEVPLTVGWYGVLRPWGERIQPLVASNLGLQLHLPGVLARLGCLERIRLTPEGVSFAELRRLTDTLLGAGERLFVLSFHSPSVVPGNTPYVRDQAELEMFLRTLDQYCEYFRARCSGTGSTLRELGHASLRNRL
jgi:hypothetical protein